MLYGHGANILDADQHTDPVAGMFFQRIRCDLSSLTTDKVALEHGVREVWLVDLEARTVTVHSPDAEASAAFGEPIPSKLEPVSRAAVMVKKRPSANR